MNQITRSKILSQQAIAERRLVQTQEEKKERITKIMAFCMICVAFFIDLIQIILTFFVIGAFISPVITACADVLFICWFWILGVNFTKGSKKILSLLGSSVLELIPAVDTLPAITGFVVYNIVITRAEDKGGIIGSVSSVLK
jgi:hypothetical protein